MCFFFQEKVYVSSRTAVPCVTGTSLQISNRWITRIICGFSGNQLPAESESPSSNNVRPYKILGQLCWLHSCSGADPDVCVCVCVVGLTCRQRDLRWCYPTRQLRPDADARGHRICLHPARLERRSVTMTTTVWSDADGEFDSAKHPLSLPRFSLTRRRRVRSSD